MADETTQTTQQVMAEAKNNSSLESATETKKETTQPKAAEKKAEPAVKKEMPKKNEATVAATLPISHKYSIALCTFIKGKTLDRAVKEVEEIIIKRRALPVSGELPHRKGMMSGRYPAKASGAFLKLLRNLGANASQLGVDVATARLSAKSDGAGRRKFGRYKGKNTHIMIQIKQMPAKMEIKGQSPLEPRALRTEKK